MHFYNQCLSHRPLRSLYSHKTGMKEFRLLNKREIDNLDHNEFILKTFILGVYQLNQSKFNT